MTGFVYVIGPASGPYKVGITKSIRSRFATLQNASAEKLYVHFTSEAEDSREAEQVLHKTLSKHRLQGEWFDCQLSVIEAAFEASGLARSFHAAVADEPTLGTLALPSMSAEDFQEWVADMRKWRFGKSEAQLAALLGVSLAEVEEMKANGADAKTGLACRALAHNMAPFSITAPMCLADLLKLETYV